MTPTEQDEELIETEPRVIFCHGCDDKVRARLTDGAEIYPHRNDLKELPFWICDNCKNYVGCHHKTDNRTQPLGTIPTEETRKARRMVHSVIDPLWKSGKIHRKKLYGKLSTHICKTYHTANITTMEEAIEICNYARSLAND